MKSNRLAWISGLSGLAMIGIGIGMYAREKQAFAGLGRDQSRAPVLNTTRAGGMTTVMRGRPGLSIEERLVEIQKQVAKSVQDPTVRKLGLQITNACPERDTVCEARSIYQWIKGNIRYTGDIGAHKQADGTVDGIDLYQSAARTIEFRGGDCDDQSILNASLMAVNGLTPVLRVVKESRAGDWVHIYPGFTDTGKWIPSDTTVPGSNFFGKDPPFKVKRDFPA